MNEPGRFGKLLALVAINVALLCVGIVAIELIMGDWFTPYVPPDAAIVDRQYVYDQELYDPPSQVVYIRDKYGLRGVHEPLPDIKIVIVGASFVDQRYITEGKTFQDVMRATENIRLANAGVDGMTSNGNILAVTEWLHKIPRLAPTYYLHLIGGTDALFSPNAKNYDRSGTRMSLRRKILSRSVFAKAFRRMRSMTTTAQGVGHSRIDVDPEASFVKAQDDSGIIEPYIEKTYAPNLNTLIALHRARSEKVIFVSQPANPQLVAWKDDGTYVSSQTPELARWAVRLRALNAVTKAVCEQHSTECHFVDLAAQLPFQAGDFYDAMHCTPSGAHKIGIFLDGKLSAIRANL